ncbi:hypothetical protein [Aquimonas sp.]|jgi:hypothetical protein|uniref:hypothetical protein n=1 Tax=Aquimonas sp. TaxID=1872588 RepID=UPI0037C0D409
MYYPETTALQKLDGLANQLFSDFHASILHEDYPTLPLSDYSNEMRWQSSGALSTPEAEQQQLSAEDLARVEAMRAAASFEASWEAGAGLSEEVRHYTAGAWAFRRNEPDRARVNFSAVLQLPVAQQQHRGSWAQYMLARMALADLREATATSTDARELAVEAKQVAAMFAHVRAIIHQQQASDPLLLARSSWGEEAAALLMVGDDHAATERYLAQAQLGSWSGRSSLLMVARAIVRDEQRLRSALDDPLLQALVTALVMSTPLDDIADDVYSPADQYPVSFNLTAYLGALQHLPGKAIAGADRLAALAYRQGHYGLATELIEHTNSPLGWWLRGKLAERAGQTDQARQAYQRAEQMWRETPQLLEQMPAQCGPQVDQARLAANAGETVDAMLQLRSTDRFEHVMTGLGLMQLSTAQLRSYFEQHGDASSDYDSVLRHALGLRLLASGDSAADAFLRGGQAKLMARHLDDARQTLGRDHRQTSQSLFAAASALRDLDNSELKAALDANPIEVDALGFDRLRGPLTGQLSSSRVAADLANQAADQLAPGSQAFAAVLCHATSWLLARNPETARIYFRRYQLQGRYFKWADDFGRGCPQPEFADAAAPSAIEPVRFKRCQSNGNCFRYHSPRSVIDDRQGLQWAQRDTEDEWEGLDAAGQACSALGEGWRLPTSTELSGLKAPLSEESMRCGETSRCSISLWFQLSSAQLWTEQGGFDLVTWQLLAGAENTRAMPALCVR